MTSYFGHTHIRLAGEEKYVSEILQNTEDFSIQVGFLLLLQQPPVLVVTKTPGDPETTSSTEDKRVCLTLIWKMSHFQKQIMSQFFQTFILNFPP